MTPHEVILDIIEKDFDEERVIAFRRYAALLFECDDEMFRVITNVSELLDRIRLRHAERNNR